MRLVCEPEDSDGDPTTVANRIEFADSTLERARGLMFRSVPGDCALVFRFSDVHRRGIHTLFVPDLIDVCWLARGKVERIERMRPFWGVGFARADTIVELPAGGADGLSSGDRLCFEDGASGECMNGG